jgi:hypothetical protein
MKYQNWILQRMPSPPVIEAMNIYLFWSEGNIEVFAFTFDPEGSNLPTEFAPWAKNGDGDALYAGPDGSLTANDTSNTVVRVVRRDGFYRGHSPFRLSESEISGLLD